MPLCMAVAYSHRCLWHDERVVSGKEIDDIIARLWCGETTAANADALLYSHERYWVLDTSDTADLSANQVR
jgi:hypothetical protein